MSEFRIHHDVNELLSLLRVRGGGEGAEVYIDLLQKNRAPYLTTTASALGAKVDRPGETGGGGRGREGRDGEQPEPFRTREYLI